MALISCPECEKEISSSALSCPHCGFPIQSSVSNDAVAASTVEDHLDLDEAVQNSAEITADDNPKGKNKFLIAILILIVGVILFGMFQGGRVTANNVGMDSMYHSVLGIGVKLGQTKNSIDKALGQPDSVQGGYQYDGGLYINYKNGKAIFLGIAGGEEWSTKGGVKRGCGSDELLKKWGKPQQTQEDGKVWLYFSGDIAVAFVMSNDDEVAVMQIVHGPSVQ